ncbi:MAG: ABC transporter substrate-binding protein [Caldilineales bacterium]
MSHKRLMTLIAMGVIASMILAGCPQPEPQVVEKVVTQEVPVVQTVVVEKEKPVEVEVVVTATPEPTAAPPSLPVVSPPFKNADTYVVITGAGEPETLDPAWTYESAGSSIEANIYEGLVWFDRERTDSFIPALATDWKVNDAGDQWVFNVRDGVRFHQGGTLEPHDVAYTTYRALLQGRIDGPHWMSYDTFFGPEYAVASVEDFAAALSGKESYAEATPEDLVAVCEAVKSKIVADDDAGTVTYNLNTATPWFLSLLAQNFLGGIVDQEWMVENGDWDGDCATWQNWANPAASETILLDQANGTGPYMLDHWTPGEEIVLTAFEDYWRDEPMWEDGPSGPASIKRVVIKDISEWGTRLAMLEAGDADYIYVPPPYRPQLEPYVHTWCDQEEDCTDGSADGYVLAYRDLPSPAITPAQFNWNINVEGGNPFIGSGELDGNGIPANFFNDIHIRRAFNYCFDFQAMIDDALSGDGIQAQGPIPAGMLGYLEGEAPMFAYDPAKCEEEFKLADLDGDGIPAGEDDDDVWSKGFYFQMAYNTGNDTRLLASEILKAGIEAVNPNFNVVVVGMPWPVLLNSRRAGKLPIYVGGWQEDYHDPHNWAHAFLHSQGAYGRIVNMDPEMAAVFDDLVLKGATTTDTEDRRAIYEELQRKAQEEAVNIWMYQVLDRWHFQPWIHGFYNNPAYSQPPYNWIYALSKQQ